MKHTTRLLAGPHLEDCPPQHLVAGNDVSLFTYVDFLHGLRSVFFPCSELWVCSQPLCVVPQRRPPAQNLHPVELLLLLSPFHQMAFLSRLQSESRPQDKSVRGETRLYKSQEQILSGRSSYPLTALQTQRGRHAIKWHFPTTRGEFTLKAPLWCLLSKDNKWPWLRRGCYHWLWRLAGLAVETQLYFL